MSVRARLLLLLSCPWRIIVFSSVFFNPFCIESLKIKVLIPFKNIEALAKLALKAKFDDFDVDSIFRKLTYPVGHRRFAKNSNLASKAQIWPQLGFCKSL
jgi:hypothetical protein